MWLLRKSCKIALKNCLKSLRKSCKIAYLKFFLEKSCKIAYLKFFFWKFKIASQRGSLTTGSLPRRLCCTLKDKNYISFCKCSWKNKAISCQTCLWNHSWNSHHFASVHERTKLIFVKCICKTIFEQPVQGSFRKCS